VVDRQQPLEDLPGQGRTLFGRLTMQDLPAMLQLVEVGLDIHNRLADLIAETPAVPVVHMRELQLITVWIDVRHVLPDLPAGASGAASRTGDTPPPHRPCCARPQDTRKRSGLTIPEKTPQTAGVWFKLVEKRKNSSFPPRSQRPAAPRENTGVGCFA
jgi:hypothetical protein